MTEHRVNPLQWLSTKFASLNHSHSEYLTSHQDITGKEDKTNKSSSISTDTGSTTKYPTVKAVEDYVSLQVSEDYGTFTELQTLINNTSNGSTLNLDKDYQCQNGENLIEINNYININGNGHIIDGNNMSNIGMYGATNLYNVKFINCHSDYNGGAVYIYGTIKIDNCLFMNNTSNGSGGALDFESDDSVVTNCVFINNKSQSNGGVLYSEYEGYKFINCIFSNNSSDSNGGALWVAPYEDDVTIKDCIFVDNTANGDGGGIYAYTHEEIKVYNCTFENSTLYNATNVDYLTNHQSLKTINNQTITGTGNINIETGSNVTVDSSWVTNSTNPVQSQLIKTALDGKANSTHNHTKSQITDFPSIPSKTSDLQNDSGFLTSHQSLNGYLQTSDVKDNLTSTDTNKPLSAKQGKVLKTSLDGKANSSHNHDDRYYTETEIDTALENKINKSQTAGLVKNDGSIMTSGTGSSNWAVGNHTHSQYLTSHQDISGKEDKSNKVTSLSENSTNTQYPSAKAVKDSLDDKTNEYDKVITSFAVQTYVTSTGGYTFEDENVVTIGGGRSFTLDFSTLDDDGDYVIFKMTKTSSTGIPLVMDSNTSNINMLPSEIKIIKEDSTFNIYDNTTNTLTGSGSRVNIVNNSSDPVSMSFGSKQIYHTVPLIDRIYPIGAIYLSVNSVNPSLFIGGTWEQIKDRFLLGSGSTYSAGSTGGEATHTLTTNEMPSHTHTQDAHNHTQNSHNHGTAYNDYAFVVSENTKGASNKRVTAVSSGSTYVPTDSSAKFHHYMKTNSQTPTINSQTATNQNTGGGQSHNNMPPYLAVYIWKRIA